MIRSPSDHPNSQQKQCSSRHRGCWQSWLVWPPCGARPSLRSTTCPAQRICTTTPRVERCCTFPVGAVLLHAHLSWCPAQHPCSTPCFAACTGAMEKKLRKVWVVGGRWRFLCSSAAGRRCAPWGQGRGWCRVACPQTPHTCVRPQQLPKHPHPAANKALASRRLSSRAVGTQHQQPMSCIPTVLAAIDWAAGCQRNRRRLDCHGLRRRRGRKHEGRCTANHLSYVGW